MRTSIKTLEWLCDQINAATGSPTEPHTRTDGNYRANVGNYHLSQAYGGVCVHRMSNESGGVSEPLLSGHRPKAEVEIAMRMFLRGIEAANARRFEETRRSA